MENNENKPSQTVLRVLVILGILAILVFLSIGIVRIVPRALNALATATTSITKLFKSDKTPITSTSTQYASSTGGFVIIATTTPSLIGTTSSTTKPSTYKPQPTTTYRPTTSYPSTYVAGNPDLAVSIYSKGVINKSTGQYIETNNFTTSDTVVIKFKVENQGTGSTGSWNLQVNMPSQNVSEQVKVISNIGSIPPGRAIEGQAIFNNPQTGNNPTVIITADPANAIVERNETNNVTALGLYVSGSNYTSPIGYAAPDLGIANIRTGIMTANNQFIPTTVFRANDRVAVQYEVINNGQQPTGPWYFQTQLTDNPIKYYNSGAETSIPGMSSVVYTVGFTNVRIGQNTITVALDPNGYLVEGNESNNVGAVNFTVTQ